VLETVTDTTAPVLETVTDTTAPVLETVTDTTAPVVDVVSDTNMPVVGAVTGTSTPLLESVQAATSPLTTATGITTSDSGSPFGENVLVTPSDPVMPSTYNVRLGGPRTSGSFTSTADSTRRGVHVPAAQAWASTPSVLSSTPSAHDRLAPAAAPTHGPDEAPQAPSVPLSGSGTASSGAFNSAALFAILCALSALALSQFGRLHLMPARWRCAAFIALLERPG
jgi:hypothetical protein